MARDSNRAKLPVELSGRQGHWLCSLLTAAHRNSHPRSGHLVARNPRSCLHLSLIPRAWAPWIPPVICRRQDLSGAGKHPQGGGAKGPSCSFPLEELQAQRPPQCDALSAWDEGRFSHSETSHLTTLLVHSPFWVCVPGVGWGTSASPPGLRIFAMVSCLWRTAMWSSCEGG